MTLPASFADLRSVMHSDPKAVAVVNQVEGKGGSPGDAALALINQGFGPGIQSEKTWSAQYRGSSELQAEFPSEAAYVSFRKFEQRKERTGRTSK